MTSEKAMYVFVVTKSIGIDIGDPEFEVLGAFSSMESAREFCGTVPPETYDSLHIWPQEIK